MGLDTKEVVRTAIRSYLTDESPESVEEFDVVFDGVYKTVEKQSDLQEGDAEDRRAGRPFCSGPEVAQTAAIAVASWVALTLVKGATKAWAKHHLSRKLDELEPRAAAAIDNPKLVHKVRIWVERTLANI